MLPSQGLRAQIDRDQYRRNMQEEISGTRGLHVREDSVEDLVIEGNEDGALPEVVGACLGIVYRCSDQHIKCCTYSQLQHRLWPPRTKYGFLPYLDSLIVNLDTNFHTVFMEVTSKSH